jgi:hypothetical protein
MADSLISAMKGQGGGGGGGGSSATKGERSKKVAKVFIPINPVSRSNNRNLPSSASSDERFVF